MGEEEIELKVKLVLTPELKSPLMRAQEARAQRKDDKNLPLLLGNNEETRSQPAGSRVR